MGQRDMNKEKHVVHSKAAPVVRVFSKLPDVKGIVCFGSYALGTFDEYSDVDLYIFCQPEIIPTAERRDALRKIEGISDLDMDHTEFGWDNQWCPRGDRFRLGDVLFDVTYNTVDWIRTVVRKVTEEGATSIPELTFRPYTMPGLLKTSIILHDPEGIVKEINSVLTPYPARLKKALITESLNTIKSSLGELHDYVKRGIGNTAFHFYLERVINSMSQLLFALNECYDPATKRTEEAYSKLTILPDDFLHRYNAILETPLTTDGRKGVARELQALVDEIEMLANKIRPE
jgi:predicted nucleotidyltransferase